MTLECYDYGTRNNVWREDEKTVILDRTQAVKLRQGNNLHCNEIGMCEKVEHWLKQNKEWWKSPIWIPKEHKDPPKHDTFIHTYELGDDIDHPIEVEDNGWFEEREIFAKEGHFIFHFKWEDLSDERKHYWQEEWWNEKPWEDLKDPGAMSEESDEDSF